MLQEITKEYLYKQQKGPLVISMTNDYQFRALMQMNEKVLRALVGALLHLKDQEIVSIEIKNAIELGTYIEDKDFILDLDCTTKKVKEIDEVFDELKQMNRVIQFKFEDAITNVLRDEMNGEDSDE